jgi:class 3 adenylate cyclase/tetratricopeptide (TPR) repeat protein
VLSWRVASSRWGSVAWQRNGLFHCVARTQAVGTTLSLIPKDGERRQVTVLYADVVGFTAFTAHAGAEHAYALMQRISKLLSATVQEQGCIVKTFTGDGILALFGAPASLEDAPLRACRAALLIEQRLTAEADDIATRHGMRPQLRMSINSGPVVFGEVAEGAVTAHGDIVNLGSRLLAVAEPGTILIGEETRQFVDGMVESHYAGTFQFKGKAEPQRAYRLVALRDDATRFAVARRRGLTEFVGRGDELETLEASLQDLRTLRVVDIVGEPGIGKSRLLHEFRRRIPRDHTFVLSGGCSPDGKQTPLLPFKEVVRGSFGLAAAEAHAVVASKIERGLSVLSVGVPQNRDLLLNLLGLPVRDALEGLDGTLIGMRTRDLLLNLVEARCRLSTVVLLLEDLHWIDNASEELLARIIDHDDAPALLLLCTRRPEYRQPWRDRSRVISLPLAPLSEQETLQIVGTRLAVVELPGTLGSLIAAKAEGNPLFAEEIVSFLVERGIVQHAASGLAYHAPAVAAVLPGSLQSLLTARIDRLPVADRSALQVAAVIGRRFNYSLLANVTGNSEDDVAQRLALMEAADLLYSNGRSGDYLFKHALVREALYETLLSAQRADWHLRVAQEIERRSADRTVEVAEILAHHYSFADEPDRTFHYLCLAGRKCLDVYSLEEAEQYFRRALRIYDAPTGVDGNAMAKAVVGLLEALYLAGNVLETKNIAELYIPKLENMGPSAELAFALYFLSLMLANLCALREGEVKARRALAIAEQTGDAKAIAYARSSVFFLATVLGQTSPEAMEAMRRQLLVECERAADNYILNWGYWSVACYYLTRGLLREARAWTARLVEAGRKREDPRALGLAYWTLSWIENQAQRYDEAAASADEALSVAVAPYDHNAATGAKAAAILLQGRVEEGLQRLRTSRDWALDNGWLYPAGLIDLFMAPAIALAGDLKGAVAMLEAGIATGDANGNCNIAAWNRIILAELYIGVITATGRPSLGFALRNLIAIVRIALTGAKRARSLLDQAHSNIQFDPLGAVCARIEFDLGRLASYEKRVSDARQHFARARAAAKAQDASIVVAAVDAALAAL